MEYIQTVLLQIDASRLEEASQAGGLLADLDDHRDYLRQQPGFRDLRITRSINNEGNVLVVIETRWSDDTSLVRYETGENNVARIVGRHTHIVARDSVQVLDMEALRTESSFRAADAGTEARQRVTLPLLVPIGVLAFALLIIYGLSRVYLEIRGDGATALAAGISIGILAVAFYLANNPRVPGWQIGGIFVVVAAVLAGGTIWAVSEEDDTAAEEPAASATPSAGSPTPAGGGGGGGGNVAVTLTDNKFDPAELTVSAGADVTFELTNNGTAIHNMHIAGADGVYTTDEGVSDPALISGGSSGTLEWTAPDSGGEILFQCDFHPTDMKGVITVE